MVAILPIIGVMVSSASKKFRKQSKKIQVAMGDVTHVASENHFRATGSSAVLVAKGYERQRFFKAAEE